MPVEVSETHYLTMIMWSAVIAIGGYLVLFIVDHYIRPRKIPGQVYGIPAVAALVFFCVLFLAGGHKVKRSIYQKEWKAPAVEHITTFEARKEKVREIQEEAKQEKQKEDVTKKIELRKSSESLFDQLWKDEKEQRNEK